MLNKNTKIVLLPLLSVILLTAFFGVSLAQVLPQNERQINISAYIINQANQEIVNGEYSVRFAIYAKDRSVADPYPSNSDAKIWEETQKVKLRNGMLDAFAGATNPLPADLNFTSGNYYLGIRINSDSEMVPRKRIGATPLAFNSFQLQGAEIGTQEGNIPLLGKNGLLDVKMMPAITDLGTVSAGVWEGDVIADSYIANALTGKTYNGLTLTSNADGFSLAGGTTSRILTVTGGDVTLNAPGAAGSVAFSNGTGYSFSSAGVAGQVLFSGGDGAPTWGAVSMHDSVTLSGTLDYLSLSGQQIALNQIDLATDVSGILPLANGGTSANLTPVSGGIVYSGVSSLGISASGTAGQVMISGGTGMPTWGSVSGGIISSDSLDFTELEDSMTLDADLNIATGLFDFVIDGQLEVGSLVVNGEATLGILGVNLTSNTSIIPSTAGLNLGSATNHWSNLYVDNLSVGSGADLNGTSSEYFTINSDSVADENMGLRFYRSALNGYSALVWNSTLSQFNLFRRENTGEMGSLNLANLYATGNVGIGTTNPQSLLSIYNPNSATVWSQPTGLLINVSGTSFGQSLIVNTDGGRVFTVSNNSQVYVGSNSGGSKLSVNGNMAVGTYYSVSAPSNGMIVSGNVGIGTTNPGAYGLYVTNQIISESHITGATLVAAGGNESIPSFRFSGDDVGMWSSGSDTLNFSTGGAEKMRINSSGYVGIGTTNPIFALDVNGSIRSSNTVYSADVAIGGNNGIIFNGSTNNAQIATIGGNNLAFNTAGSWRMYINSSGNVGIGTTAPGSTLDVAGIIRATNGANYLEMYHNGTDSILSSSSGEIMIGAGGDFILDSGVNLGIGVDSPLGMLHIGSSSPFIVTSAGNVGIGTTSPNAKLHVLGIGGVNTFESSSSSGGSNYASLQISHNSGGTIINTTGGAAGTPGDLIFTNSGTFEGAGAFSMIIKQGGNVGIGYVNPGTAKLAINGNVGIGTTNPQSALDVEGIITSLYPSVGTPTYGTVNDFLNFVGTAGRVSGGAINDAGSGNITVDAGTGYVRIGATNISELRAFDWSALGATAIPANTVRYVGVNYNSGTPVVEVRATDNWNYYDNWPLGMVSNVGGTIHVNQDGREFPDQTGRLIRRFYGTRPYERDERQGGLVIGETGTRNVTLSGGTLWDRSNNFTINSFDSSGADRFDIYYRDGASGWTEVVNQAQWPNTQYDNNSGTLQTATNSKWLALWFYLETDGNIVMLYGQNQYNSQALAAASAAPANVPARITAGGRLIGRFIFQKSDATALIETVWDSALNPTLVADHGSLAGLSDDDHTQYALLAGRTGGQTLIGGITADESLTIQGNSAAAGNTATNANLQFKVGNSGTTTAMTILNNGNVGIGTTNPSALLSVGSASSFQVTSSGLIGLGGATPLFSLGVDATDSNKFKIYSGSGIAGTSEFSIDTDGLVSIANLEMGAQVFADDSGAISWIDMGVVSALDNTVESYTAQLDGTDMLTIYGQSNGSGGVDNLRVLFPNGNVGIGTTNPTYNLDVAGTLGIGGTAYFASSVGIGTTNPGYTLDVKSPSSGIVARFMGPNTSNVEIYQDSTSSSIRGGYGGAAKDFRITGGTYLGLSMSILASDKFNFSGGNVGIGTTNPLALLEVNGTAWLRGGTAPTSGLFVNSSGNVGIGTTNPGTYNLHISGTEKITAGSLYIDNGYSLQNVAGNAIFAIANNSPAIYGSNSVRFSAGASFSDSYERMRIDGSTGFVGIGTTNPLSMLDIFGTSNALRLSYDADNYASLSANASGELVLTGTSAGGSSIVVGSALAEDTSLIFDGNAQDYHLGLDDTNDSFNIGLGQTLGTTSLLTILSGGNVGIGTTNPENKLSVLGTISVDSASNGSGVIKMYTAGIANRGVIDMRAGSAENIVKIETSGNSYFNGGNVGIGTTNPGAKLDIAGDLNVSMLDATDQTVFSQSSVTGTEGQPLIFINDDRTGATANDATEAALRIDAEGGYAIYVQDGDLYFSGTTVMATPRILNSGSVSAPILYVGDDQDTGWWRPADNSIAFSGGGSEKLRIDNNGNVGIGTTAPGSTLDVAGIIRATNGSNYISMYHNGTDGIISSSSGEVMIGAGGDFILDSGVNLGIGVDSPLGMLHIGSSSPFIVTSAGNVGIGTTNPSTLLHINGTGTGLGTLRIEDDYLPQLDFYDDSTYEAVIGTNGSDMYVRGITGNLYLGSLHAIADVTIDGATGNVGIGTLTPGTAGLAIMNGNVGIGTTNPGNTLKVVGSICASATDVACAGTTAGSIYADNFIAGGTALNIPDYVFEANYNLMPLDQLAAYIAEHKHLPGVPSAEDIEKAGGLNLGQMVPAILEKTEENTLYILGLDLKTDQNITTLQELQTSVDENLDLISNSQLSISNEFTIFNDKISKLESGGVEQDSLIAILQTQLAELKAENGMNLTNILQNTTDIGTLTAQVASILGNEPDSIATRLANLETLSLFSSRNLENGGLEITIVDPDAPTIGNSSIAIGEKTKTVSTQAVKVDSKIFVSPKSSVALQYPLTVTDITEGESFEVSVFDVLGAEVEFDWWIVEAKEMQ